MADFSDSINSNHDDSKQHHNHTNDWEATNLEVQPSQVIPDAEKVFQQSQEQERKGQQPANESKHP